MVITKTFSKREDILRLRDLALSVPEPVTVRSLDGQVSMNAKSPMGIYELDFSQPVQIVTDSPVLAQEVEQW